MAREGVHSKDSQQSRNLKLSLGFRKLFEVKLRGEKLSFHLVRYEADYGWKGLNLLLKLANGSGNMEEVETL